MNFKYLLFTAVLLIALLFKTNAQPFTGSGSSGVFTGANYIPIPTGTIDKGFTSGTIELWAKPTGSTDGNCIFSMRNADTKFSLHLMMAAKRIDIWTNAGSGVRVLSYPFIAGTWYHFAFVMKEQSTDVYINGVFLGKYDQGALTSTVTNTGIGIGSLSNGGEYFQGELDDVRLWSTLRTPEQIAANMSKEIASPSTEEGLLLYYNFNDPLLSTQATFLKDNNCAIKVLAPNKVQLTTPSVSAVSGKKMYIRNDNGRIDGAVIDVASPISSTIGTNNTYIYTFSPSLAFSDINNPVNYYLEVESNSYTSAATTSFKTFTKKLDFSYWYELNTAVTYPAPNSTNIPTNLSKMVIAFTDKMVKLSTTETGTKKVRIRTLTGTSDLAYCTIGQSASQTSPFTFPIAATLQLGTAYRIIVDAGSFTASDGTGLEAERIWTFNTIATTATDKALKITGNAVSNLVTVIDAATNTTTNVLLNMSPAANAFTQECWFKFEGYPTGFNCVFASYYTPGYTTFKDRSPSIYFSTTRGWVESLMGLKTTTEISGSSTFEYKPLLCYELGWNHFAQTFDGDKLRLYVNGSLFSESASAAGKIMSNNLMATIGGCTGIIDEVRVWKIARSEQDIKDGMYVKGSAISGIGGLVGYWNFDDGKVCTDNLTVGGAPVSVLSNGTYVANDNPALIKNEYEKGISPNFDAAAPIVVSNLKMQFTRAVASAIGGLTISELNASGAKTGVTYEITDITTNFTSAVSRLLNVTLPSPVTLKYATTYSVEFNNASFTDVNGTSIAPTVANWGFKTVDPASITIVTNPSSSPSSTFSISATRTVAVYYKVVKDGALIPPPSELKSTGKSVTIANVGTPITAAVGEFPVGNYKVYAVMVSDDTDVIGESNVFAITSPTISITEPQPSRTALGFRATADRKGIAYYTTVPSSVIVLPAPESIVNSIYSTNITAANSPFLGSVAGLRKTTNYKLLTVIKDLSGSLSPVVETPFSTIDGLVTPTLSYISKKLDSNSVTFDVTSTEEGNIYWVLLPISASAPAASTITGMISNGTASSGTTKIGSSTINYELAQTFAALDLVKSSNYIAYVVAKNANGATSNVLSIPVTTTAGSLAITLFSRTIKERTAQLIVKPTDLTRSGKFYWVVLNSTAAAPTSGAALQSMVGTTTAPIVTTGNTTTLLVTGTINIAGLTLGVDYKAYVLMVDGSFNQSNVLEVPFTTVDVATELANADFTVYPNPAKDVVSVAYTLTEETDVTIDLYTISGVKVKSESVKKSKGEQKVSFDVSDLANGTYVYQLRTNKGTTSKQLIIKH